MKTTALVFWLVLALAATASYAGWIVYRHAQEKATDDGSVADSAAAAQNQVDLTRTRIPLGDAPIPGFKLTDQNGKEFDSQCLRGKVCVASYFFTSCPGPCYRLNQELAGLQGEKELDDVKFVSITCDPTNDTPDELRKYAARFSADPKRWTFLTGDEAKVERIGTEGFLVPVASKTHSDLAVVLDRQSRIRGHFHLTDGTDVIRMRKRLRELLSEKVEPDRLADESRVKSDLKRAATVDTKAAVEPETPINH